MYNNENRPTIYTVSSPCGTGKTYATCNHIANHRAQNFLYVAPTKHLLKQTEAELRDRGIQPTLIVSDTSNRQPVVSRIADYVKAVQRENLTGQVLLITHKAFFDLPEYLNLNDWEVFIDELPPVDTRHFIWLKYNQQIIGEYLELDDLAPVNDRI